MQQKHITEPEKNQEGIAPPDVAGTCGLKYKPMDFKAKRWRQAAIAHAAELASMEKRAEKYAACGTALEFGIDAAGRHMTAANFCRQRLCPICQARLAKKNGRQLAQVLAAARQKHPGLQFLFLTISPRNCGRGHLRAGIGELTTAWARLMDYQKVRRAVLGSFRAIEVTRNAERAPDLEWNHHIHAIWAVDEGYFHSSDYINQPALVELWGRALRADYAPKAHISAIYAKNGSGDVERQTEDAVKEAAKYASKDSDIIGPKVPEDERPEIFRELFVALAGRRLTGFSGILRKVAKELGADDLETASIIDADEDKPLPEDAFPFYEAWNWEVLVGDYVLHRVYDRARNLIDTAGEKSEWGMMPLW